MDSRIKIEEFKNKILSMINLDKGINKIYLSTIGFTNSDYTYCNKAIEELKSEVSNYNINVSRENGSFKIIFKKREDEYIDKDKILDEINLLCSEFASTHLNSNTDREIIMQEYLNVLDEFFKKNNIKYTVKDVDVDKKNIVYEISPVNVKSVIIDIIIDKHLHEDRI